jgi:stress response protein SCP2
MKAIAYAIPAILLGGFLYTTSSCQKDTDCKATVHCMDSTSKNVDNADVLLYALVKSPDGKTTYTADVKANGTTDADGEVSFVFKLPAIYDVKATKVVGTKTLTGLGIIKLEEGKTVDKDITMK